MQFLKIFNKNYRSKQILKERILKNKEGVLDIMSENVKGTRQCDGLLGQKCIGVFCEQFMEFNSISLDGKKTKFFRCSKVQTPLLLLEVNDLLRKVIDELREMKKLIENKNF